MLQFGGLNVGSSVCLEQPGIHYPLKHQCFTVGTVLISGSIIILLTHHLTHIVLFLSLAPSPSHSLTLILTVFLCVALCSQSSFIPLSPHPFNCLSPLTLISLLFSPTHARSSLLLQRLCPSLFYSFSSWPSDCLSEPLQPWKIHPLISFSSLLFQILQGLRLSSSQHLSGVKVAVS